MDHTKETTDESLVSVQKYGIMLIVALVVLYGFALFAVQWIEQNEIRNELARWSQTLPKQDQTQPEKALHLPEDIIALHVGKLERTGFYQTRTDKNYLSYANPDNDYILQKSEESIEHEVANFAIMLSILFVGNIILLFGWWRFTQSKVRELFEVA